MDGNLRYHQRILKNENFSWNTSLNFSLDKNKITELAGGNFISGTKEYEVGRSLFGILVTRICRSRPNDGRMMWYRDVTAADRHCYQRNY